MEKENKDKSAKWLIKFNNNISIVEIMVSNSFEEELDEAHFLKVKCLYNIHVLLM